MSNKSAEELAKEVSKPGKFSFIDRLRGRNYPTDEVVVYLDEKLGYKLLAVEQEMAGSDGHTPSFSEQKLLEEKHAELVEQLRASRYVVKLQGISNDDWDALVEEAAEQFPYEYDEIVNPFSGEKTRKVIETDERAEFFTMKLWAAFIQSITDSDGNVDDDVTVQTVKAFRGEAPFSAITRVGATIAKLRMATDWVEYIEDEDFLAKP